MCLVAENCRPPLDRAELSGSARGGPGGDDERLGTKRQSSDDARGEVHGIIDPDTKWRSRANGPCQAGLDRAGEPSERGTINHPGRCDDSWRTGSRHHRGAVTAPAIQTRTAATTSPTVRTEPAKQCSSSATNPRRSSRYMTMAIDSRESRQIGASSSTLPISI